MLHIHHKTYHKTCKQFPPYIRTDMPGLHLHQLPSLTPLHLRAPNPLMPGRVPAAGLKFLPLELGTPECGGPDLLELLY